MNIESAPLLVRAVIFLFLAFLTGCQSIGPVVNMAPVVAPSGGEARMPTPLGPARKTPSLPKGTSPVLLDVKVALGASDSGLVQERVSGCVKDRVYAPLPNGQWRAFSTEEFKIQQELGVQDQARPVESSGTVARAPVPAFVLVTETPEKLEDLKKLVVRVKRVKRSKDHVIEAQLFRLEQAGWISETLPQGGRYADTNSRGRKLEMAPTTIGERVCGMILRSVAQLAEMKGNGSAETHSPASSSEKPSGGG